MRDHLATLLCDFRRFDRQIAVVRHQGIRRRVTSYGEIAQLAGRFAALLVQRGIGRVTAFCSGLKIARSGLPPSMAASCVAYWLYRWTLMAALILPRAWPRMCNPNWRLATRCCLRNCRRNGRGSPSKTGFPRCRLNKPNPLRDSRAILHSKFYLPLVLPANPKV